MYITPAYASLLILFFIALSVRTLRLRRRLGIAIGDQGNEVMTRAMRVHANFAEYVPLAILGILMVELQGNSGVLIHLLCLSLLVGRVSHACGVSRTSEDFRYRVFGMAMTLTTLGITAITLLIGYVWTSPTT